MYTYTALAAQYPYFDGCLGSESRGPDCFLQMARRSYEHRSGASQHSLGETARGETRQTPSSDRVTDQDVQVAVTERVT